MSDESNIYFEILAWGNNHIDLGVSFAEFGSFLDGKEASIGLGRRRQLFKELFDHCERANQSQGYLDQALNSGEKFRLNVEASFRHIERLELVDARKSSKQAMCTAILAIVIGALVGVMQIAISFGVFQATN
jgi:hypothetical protein